MTTPRPASRSRRLLALGAILPAVIALALVSACAPKVDEAAAQEEIRARLASIEGVSSVEDLRIRTDYGKSIDARLEVDTKSTVDLQVVLVEGVQILWSWPAWRPGVSMTVGRGSEFVGATNLVDPSSQDSYLSSSDMTELFGEWTGQPSADRTPLKVP